MSLKDELTKEIEILELKLEIEKLKLEIANFPRTQYYYPAFYPPDMPSQPTWEPRWEPTFTCLESNSGNQQNGNKNDLGNL